METTQYSLPPFRFDAVTETLWQGNRARRLRPRAAALLRHLIEHRGEVVSTADILSALWPEVRVAPGVVKVYVWEIRQALRDRQQTPRYVETVPRRGYRWIGEVAPLAPERGAAAAVRAPLVGRASERALLLRYLESAKAGARRFVFVTGEPGIGKSALVEDFIRHVADRAGLAAVAGQCIEHSGAGEAYLPVLTALGELARGPRRGPLVRVLARYAPTWLAQLPDALEVADRDVVLAAARGASRDRMLREISDALEQFTARRPLVLVIEDLQWSDASTLDLIAFLARRPGRARLMVLATHRPADVARGAHPLPALVSELSIQGRCASVPLGFLGVADVTEYLRALFGEPRGGVALDSLAAAIHLRTEGNPLFLVNVVEELGLAELVPHAIGDAVARVRDSVPASLAQAIEARIRRLPDGDQELLEAASAAGVEFSSAALAAALGQPLEDAERRCAGLARGAGIVEARGEEVLPDGTLTGRFGFVHALYQSVLYRRLTPVRRRAQHRRIADRLDAAFGARRDEIATVLALHRELAGQPEQAIVHLENAATTALVKHANSEAVRHLTQALGLLATLPHGPERAQRELGLQVRLGAPLLLTRGYAAPEVSAAYGRALELCRVVGESPEKLLALAGIYRFSLIRSELRTAREVGEQVLAFAERSRIPLAFQIGHLMLGITSFGLGAVARAREHLAQSLAMHDGRLGPSHSAAFGDDPLVVCRAHAAMTSWFAGEPDSALAHCEQALAHARAAGLPHGLVFALDYATWCRLLRREVTEARVLVDELLSLARESDFPYWVAQGTAIQGWVAIEEGRVAEGIEQIREGLAAYESIGAEVMRPWHLVRLGEAYGQLGRVAEGLGAVAQAFADMRRKDERFYEPELHRVEGELQLAAGDEERAIECFARALETARGQGAVALELRAAVGLARLHRPRRDRAAARSILAGIVATFREGRETGDVRTARHLLADLAG